MYVSAWPVAIIHYFEVNMSETRLRRVGKVRISQSYFSRYPRAVATVLRELTVISAERNWETDEIVYLGFHHSFEPLPEGSFIPEYRPEIIMIDFPDGFSGLAVQEWVRVPDLPHIDLLKRLRDAVMALDGTSVENERLFDDYMDYMKQYGVNQGE